ncbi:MAG: hypothetical protein ACFCVE_04160 [Phycisphaerae bacterium]
MKRLSILLLPGVAAAWLIVGGCADTAVKADGKTADAKADTQAERSGVRQRQENALRDPFGYGPELPGPKEERVSPISDSDGLADDLRRLLDP